MRGGLPDMSDAGTALTAELAEVERQIGTPAWWHDEGLQQRHRDLIDAQQTGTAAPPAPSAVTKERDHILGIMRDDPRKYWRDETMQVRLLELNGLIENAPTPAQQEQQKLATIARKHGETVQSRREAVDRQIALTEHAMRADRAAYDKNPEMQRQYLALLTEREGGDPTAAAPAAPPGDWRATPAVFRERNPELAAEWQGEPDGDARLARAEPNHASGDRRWRRRTGFSRWRNRAAGCRADCAYA